MRVLQLLREQLETYAALDPQVPVVRLIVGDDNLYAREARQELQRTRDEDPLWEVHPAAADRQGDHVAVNGAAATPIDISICLLYTSDAADEGLGVDLGGRRII